MIQRRNGAGFPFEALLRFGIGREMRRQNFHSDRALEPRVAGAVHLAHAARAERRLNFIRPKFGA